MVLLRIRIRTKERGSQRDNQKERLTQKGKLNGPHGQAHLGHGIKIKVGKEKAKVNKYVLIVVVKITQ